MTKADRYLIWERDDARLMVEARRASGGNILYAVRLRAYFGGYAWQPPQEVRLLAEYYDSRPRILIEDLDGNGYNSGLKGLGTGTLIMNTATQLFRAAHPLDTLVEGRLSEEDPQDPKDPEIAAQCRADRERFWAGYGLRKTTNSVYGPKITGKLGDMAVQRVDRMIQGRIPTMIELDAFRDDQL